LRQINVQPRPAFSLSLCIGDRAILKQQEQIMRIKPRLREMTPTDVHNALLRNDIVLIDVREPPEYVAERIHGSLLFPLSTFDPAALPLGDRPVVLHCGSGKRSAVAVAKCAEAGVPITTHMSGGIMAWKHARLPTITLDPGTGAAVDRR
jgi:rhodanese-related sulfurtransferase